VELQTEGTVMVARMGQSYVSWVVKDEQRTAVK